MKWLGFAVYGLAVIAAIVLGIAITFGVANAFGVSPFLAFIHHFWSSLSDSM